MKSDGLENLLYFCRLNLQNYEGDNDRQFFI